MLKGIKILDFTHRLPGPLAGKILSDLGAEVVKVEDEKHKDPFLSGMFSDFDKSFEDWYEELNRGKKIVRLDFKSPDIKDKIKDLLKGASGVMLSLSPKLKSNLGLTDEDLKQYALAAIDLEASSTHNKAMHDLNALAISGHLALHIEGEERSIVPPPFFPVAGIAFGQQVATEMLALILESKTQGKFVKSVSYLHDTAQRIFDPFWPKKIRAEKRTKFLHNGAYPCYSLYRTLDGQYVALAAVEDKFWIDLLETFPIALPLERRFETSPEAFKMVADVFGKLTAQEIESKSQNKELCLSIVRKVN